MPAPFPPESVEGIRVLFAERLTKINIDLIQALGDLMPHIQNHDPNAALGLLALAEERMDAMRTVLIVFRECLEG